MSDRGNLQSREGIMTQATLPDRFTATQAALEQAGQGHVLTFFDRLNDQQKEQLLSQIDASPYARKNCCEISLLSILQFRENARNL